MTVCKNDHYVILLPKLGNHIFREGVRGVAGVAFATTYFGHIRIGSNNKINYKKINFLLTLKKNHATPFSKFQRPLYIYLFFM